MIYDVDDQNEIIAEMKFRRWQEKLCLLARGQHQKQTLAALFLGLDLHCILHFFSDLQLFEHKVWYNHR